MQQLLLKVWDETASTILFVTHNVSVAAHFATHVALVHGSVQFGTSRGRKTVNIVA